jgi:hypothetical protein
MGDDLLDLGQLELLAVQETLLYLPWLIANALP